MLSGFLTVAVAYGYSTGPSDQLVTIMEPWQTLCKLVTVNADTLDDSPSPISSRVPVASSLSTLLPLGDHSEMDCLDP